MHPPKTKSQWAYEFGLVFLQIGWLAAFFYLAFIHDVMRDKVYLSMMSGMLLLMAVILLMHYNVMKGLLSSPFLLFVSAIALLQAPVMLWARDLLQLHDPVYWVGVAGLAHLVLALWGWWAYRHHFHSTA